MLPSYLEPYADNVQEQYRQRQPTLISRQEKSWAICEIIVSLTDQVPGAAVVRHFTGTGSLTDINRDVQAFGERRRTSPSVQRVTLPDVPPALIGRVEDFVDTSWREAVALANEGLQQRRLEIEASNQAAMDALKVAQEQQAAAETYAAKLERDLAAIRTRNLELERDAVATQISLTNALERLSTVSNSETDLKRRLADTVELMDTERRRHMLDLDGARQEAREKDQQVKNATLAIAQLEQKVTTERTLSDAAKNRAFVLEQELAVQKGRYTELQSQIAKLEEEAIRQRHATGRLRAQRPAKRILPRRLGAKKAGASG